MIRKQGAGDVHDLAAGIEIEGRATSCSIYGGKTGVLGLHAALRVANVCGIV